MNNTGQALVSIILPIYNVEKYLDRCLKSVTEQTYKNLEIILVDDGSKDSCPQKCDQWAEIDNRIRVIHKNNAGLGEARNTGIDNANGEYIYFLDSDDYINDMAIERMVCSATQNASDIVIFGFSKVSKTGKLIISVKPHPQKECYSGKEISEVILPNLFGGGCNTERNMGLWGSAWTSFFSMSLIRITSWRFASERKFISEDVYSFLDLYSHVNTISIIPDCLYYYCENENSLSHTYRKERVEKINIWLSACLELCEKNRYPVSVEKSLFTMYFSNIIGAMKTMVCALDKKSALEELKRILNDNITKDFLSYIDAKSEDKKGRLSEVMYNLVESICIGANLLIPFMPETAQKILMQLHGTERDYDLLADYGLTAPGTRVTQEPEILFARLDMKEIMAEVDRIREAQKAEYEKENGIDPSLSENSDPSSKDKDASEAEYIDIEAKPEITYDDFAKLQLQVGEIIECEEVKKSKKLLCSKVRIGSEVRQILSGIKACYKPEEMVGKKVVVLTNLAPRQIAGLTSEGMLLCAENAEGELSLLSIDKDMPAGAEIG